MTASVAFQGSPGPAGAASAISFTPLAAMWALAERPSPALPRDHHVDRATLGGGAAHREGLRTGHRDLQWAKPRPDAQRRRFLGVRDGQLLAQDI